MRRCEQARQASSLDSQRSSARLFKPAWATALSRGAVAARAVVHAGGSVHSAALTHLLRGMLAAMKPERAFGVLAILLGVVTVVMGAEPSFGQVGGGPIGVGIAAAGFAIAAALVRR